MPARPAPPTDVRQILLTGASGIGQATAARLADAGHLVAAARRAGELKALAAAHPAIRPVVLDITDPASIDHARHQIQAETGGHGLDVLINAAGILALGPVEAVSDPQTRAQFEVNLFGTLAVTRAFLPSMRERGAGRIVNVSSIMGRFALPGSGIYARPSSPWRRPRTRCASSWRPSVCGSYWSSRGHRHPAVCAGRRLPGDDQALGPYRATWPAGFGFPTGCSSRRVGRHHRRHPGRGGAGGPPSPTVPAWAAQPPQHPAADHAAHRVGGSDQAADRRRGNLPRTGPTAPTAPPPPSRAAAPTRRAPTPRGTSVNRCGDRTARSSTLDRHRGLILAGSGAASASPASTPWSMSCRARGEPRCWGSGLAWPARVPAAAPGS